MTTVLPLEHVQSIHIAITSQVSNIEGTVTTKKMAQRKRMVKYSVVESEGVGQSDCGTSNSTPCTLR
eukprot:NODE_12778_length_203_cov_9.681818_g12037_i0.p1 GENE.NODE_12778_length_203_cov_9.681818_g12037_i0~~NODE_12778_length_203_cov_9.681818_g12037_i0.p1  ORF type:complete len:67 (+),score=3.24 NODE_12778_length_203_cov_9.681818_g12037_i0:2-202(+)